MARSNKYTSLNFNDIYEKKNPTTANTAAAASSSFSSAHPNKSYSLSASSRLGHGGMLVLSRPSPKPVSLPSPPLSPSPSLAPRHVSDHVPPESSSISLRPQGKTGSGPSPTTSFPTLELENKEARAPLSPSPSPKSDKFVPPHLRPGFVARDRPSGPRPGNYRPGSGPNRYGEDGRPKSGGGYDRRMRGVFGGGESDLVELNRPRSGGSRPS